jgi:hypothetical protein
MSEPEFEAAKEAKREVIKSGTMPGGSFEPQRVKQLVKEACAGMNVRASAVWEDRVGAKVKKRARRTQFEKWVRRWTSWCTYVGSALEELQKLQNEYREDWDRGQDALRRVRDVDLGMVVEIIKQAESLARPTDLRLREMRSPTVPAADDLSRELSTEEAETDETEPAS